MESPQALKHRTRDEPNTETMSKNNNKARRPKRMAMAKRGVRSLAVAVVVPLSITLATISLFASSSHSYHMLQKPFWFPSLWVLYLTSMASTLLMGLSAWLVWAEGGFHRRPIALAMYIAHLCLSLAWDPIVFVAGDDRVGLGVCLAMLGALAVCVRMFHEVNPIAGDLVMPCLAWAGFLAIVNLTLLFI